MVIVMKFKKLISKKGYIFTYEALIVAFLFLGILYVGNMAYTHNLLTFIEEKQNIQGAQKAHLETDVMFRKAELSGSGFSDDYATFLEDVGNRYWGTDKMGGTFSPYENVSDSGGFVSDYNESDYGDSLPYWIEPVNGNYKVWVEVSNIPANGDVEMIIKKVSGYSANGDAVFEYFNDTEVTFGEYQIGYSWDFNAIGYVIETLVEPTGSGGGVPYFTDGTSTYSGADLYMSCTHRGGNKIDCYDGSYHTIVMNPTYPAKAIIKLKDNSNVDYIIYNQGEALNANYRENPSRIDTMWCGGSSHMDWEVKAHYIFIRKYAPQEPEITKVEQIQDGYRFYIHNPNNQDLNNFQIGIPASGTVDGTNYDLNIADKDESLNIITYDEIERKPIPTIYINSNQTATATLTINGAPIVLSVNGTSKTLDIETANLIETYGANEIKLLNTNPKSSVHLSVKYNYNTPIYVAKLRPINISAYTDYN